MRASLQAWDRKDEAGWMGLVGDELVYDELFQPRAFVGKARVQAWFGAWTRAVPEALTEILRLLGVGEHVLAETIVRGTLRGPLGAWSPSDRPFSVHRAAVFRLADGEIVRVTGFLNGKELAEAIGQWLSPRG